MKKKTKGLKTQKVPWYGRRLNVYLLLIGVTVLAYFRVFTLGYTMLDDTIFIKENQEYNKSWSNIPVSFQRGLFNPTGDSYYRPVFLVDFIIESKFFGTSPAGYHFSNLLFHVLCVLLLYLFFLRLKIPDLTALILTLIFTVHPVLTQAVAWIPGRNDMLLMIFFLSGTLLTLKYRETPKWQFLVAQFLMLLLALFTKETAVIIPIIILAVLAMDNGQWKMDNGKWKTENGKWKNDRRNSLIHNFFLLISWALALVIWFLVRSAATLKPQDFTLTDLLVNGFNRAPVLIQYLGKIFFPFNLTVFPDIRLIAPWWGMVALVLLIGLIILSRSYARTLTWIGLGWYILFLIPVLVVPASLNDQVFEHRLYLPIVGILLVLGQVSMSLNSKIKDQGSKTKDQNPSNSLPNSSFALRPLFVRQVSQGAIVFVLLLFSGLTFYRIGYFKDSVTFWTAAVDDNPTSAYARMMLGLRMTEPAQMKQRFEEAYRLNPNEKMLNYLIGKLALDDNDIPRAERHLKKEVEFSQIPDNYFNLARVCFLKNIPDSAAFYLEQVIRLEPRHPQANHNLLLLYLQLDRRADARHQIQAMRDKGLEIPPEVTGRADLQP
ncbi:MAG: hypothetical protein EOM90_14855 [Alphaproteobacteria bacterium]|nr:hypothetical protein [Alphaproteobacteria bacterium]